MSSKKNRFTGALDGDTKPKKVPDATSVYSKGKPIVPRRKQQIQQQITENGIQIGKFRITTTGLDIPDDTSEDEYADLGKYLLSLQGAVQWCIGDWIAFGDNHQWGETYKRLAEEFGYEEQTLRTFAYVARNVLIRNQQLTFSHHRQVSGLEDQDAQAHWLEQAAKNNWTIKQMKAAMRGDDGKSNGPASHLVDTEKKKVFAQIWRAVERDDAIDSATLDQMEAWLKEVRDRLGTSS